MIRNILVHSEDELTLIYALDTLTDEELKAFFIKVCRKDITDYFEEEQDALQYYCIDGRTRIDTPELVARVREILRG